MAAAAAVVVHLPTAVTAREPLAVVEAGRRSMAPTPAKAVTAALAWSASTSGNAKKKCLGE